MIPVPPAVASLTEYVIERCDAVEVEVHWVGIDPTRVSEDADLAWFGDPCRSRPELRLEVVDEGHLEARFTVRPSLTTWVAVPVAQRAASKGDRVASTPGRARIQDVRGTPRSSGTWIARVKLAVGDPITDAVTMAPLDGATGDAVRLAVRSGDLSIHAPGRLLSDARIGESVRVVNDATHATLRGVLVAPGVVEIGRTP